MLKNTIEDYQDAVSGANTKYRQTDEDGMFETFQTIKSYMCESLIEYDGKYFLIVTHVSLEHLRVVKYEKVSVFSLSAAEATMMTRRSDYITVMDVSPYAPEFTQESTILALSLIHIYAIAHPVGISGGRPNKKYLSRGATNPTAEAHFQPQI